MIPNNYYMLVLLKKYSKWRGIHISQQHPIPKNNPSEYLHFEGGRQLTQGAQSFSFKPLALEGHFDLL